MGRSTSYGPVFRLFFVLIVVMAALPGGSRVVAQGATDPDDTTYENPQFGFTVEWSAPWSSLGEISDSVLGFEGITLEAEPFRVLVAGIPGETPAEVVQLTIAQLREENSKTQVVAQDQQGEAATATFDVDAPGGPRRGYLESRPLGSPETMLLVVLDGPIDAFDQGFADALVEIDVNGALPFIGVPSDATSDLGQDGLANEATGDVGEVSATPDTAVSAESVAARDGVPMVRGNPARTGVMRGPGPERVPGVLWRFATGDSVYSSPAVVAGVAYIGGNDGRLYAVDATSGEEVWRFQTEAQQVSSAAVSEGVVFVGADDGVVYAVDAVSGEERWRFAAGGFIYASPVVVNDVVYVGGSAGLFALDAVTGEELWRFTAEGVSFGDPAVVSDVVYAAGDTFLFAVDANNGEELWRFEEPEADLESGPVVIDGTIVVGSEDGGVFAVDAESGEELWRVTTGSVNTAPAAAVGTIYVGDDAFLYALDAKTGEELWRAEMEDGIEYSSPTVARGVVFAADAAALHALDATTGDEIWRLETEESQLTSDPVALGGTIYAASEEGTLFAFGDETSVAVTPVTTQQTQSAESIEVPDTGEALNLPAMVLQPDDLAAAGLGQGFGLLRGDLDSLIEAAETTAQARGDRSEEHVADVTATLESARFLQSYYQDLAAPAVDDPTRVGTMVRSGFDEYADEAGATAGLAFFADKSEIVDIELGEVTTSRRYGDESILTRFTGVDTVTGLPFQALSLEVQVGRLIPFVTVWDWTNQEPEVATVEELMEQLLARIEAGARPAAFDPGYLVARLEGADVEVGYDGYTRLGGVTVPFFGDSPEILAQREAATPDALDIYFLSHTIQAGEEGYQDDGYYQVSLYRFASSQAAQAWLDSFLPGITAEAIVTDMLPLGEQTLTYRSEVDRGDGVVATGFVTYLRTEAEVLVLDVSAGPGIDQAAYQELVSSNFGCLLSGRCIDPVPLPIDLIRTTMAATPAAGTPEAVGSPAADGATRSPGATPQPGAGGEGFYRAVNGDWSITWDEQEWTLQEVVNEDGDDLRLAQVNEPSARLQLRTRDDYDQYEGDAATCLEGLVELLTGSDVFGEFAPLEDAAGNAIAGEDNVRAYGAYRFVETLEDGETQPFGAYIACYTVVPGEEVLAILYTVDLNRFAEQFPEVEQLLEGLEIELGEAVEPADLSLP